MKEISAGGVVYYKENNMFKLLLIEDKCQKWTLPKGKNEQGETFQETALREISEETGIKGEVIKPLDKIFYEYYLPSNERVEKEVHFYLVKALSKQINVQATEINSAIWISIDKVLQIQSERGYINNNIVIEKAMKELGYNLIGGNNQMNKKELARMIDHTLLKPETTVEMIDKLCAEAKEYHFASVCVNPFWVKRSYQLLKDTDVLVCTVIGFPLGATTKEVKAYETMKSIEAGATEIDMVINVGALKTKQFDVVEEDIKAVVEAAKGKALVKVILETGLLNEEEKIKGCELSKKAGADFVKTSTGFGNGGATYEDIKLMRETVGPEMGVKASGGVRDLDGALKLVEAGATRIGASSGIAILNGLVADTDY